MDHLPTIYGAAVLLPLASFVTILLFARQLGKVAGSIATGAILVSAVLSFLGFGIWISNFPPMPAHFPTVSQVLPDPLGYAKSVENWWTPKRDAPG